MIRPQRYFPWKVARQYFLSHFVFIVVTLVLTGFSLRYYVYRDLTQSAIDINRSLDNFDRHLTTMYLAVLAGAVVYLILSTRYYVRPLGHLIQRARELRRFDAPLVDENIRPEELSEEPGEWFDLERAVYRIHKDLRTKTEALAREREELSTLMGAVSDAILAIDSYENPLFFNSQFAHLFQVAQGGGKTLTLGEMFRVPEILQGYRAVLADGQMRHVSATVHTGHHKVRRYFSISIAPIRTSERDPVHGAVGVFHDVTELKQAEQVRIEFVGNASHELRTPLTNIKGYVETLRADIKTNRIEAASPFVDVISRNVDRLISLVNDLLDLSVIESGAELKKSSLSTRDVTEAALRQLETRRDQRRQDIRTRFGVERVLGDARRVEQVIVNLVHNAIKYVPEGTRIEISWEPSERGAILKIKDDGPGIPQEHHSRLFERFYRVDPGRARDQGGTGLGLSIVKHIMIKHGGSVRLTSRPGEGAEFVCFFPE